MLLAKTKGKVCVHTLPRATAVLKPASLLREGSGTAMCPRLWTPPLCLGGSSGAAMCLEALDPPRHPGGIRPCHASLSTRPASLLRLGPVLTCVLRHRSAPAPVVGSSADTCPMSLRRPWAVEIKEGLVATACSEARVFSRHAHMLPRHLQDVWADNVIMTYKPCGQVLQHRTTVHHRADNNS
jgi:hypothetical protein